MRVVTIDARKISLHDKPLYGFNLLTGFRLLLKDKSVTKQENTDVAFIRITGMDELPVDYLTDSIISYS